MYFYMYKIKHYFGTYVGIIYCVCVYLYIFLIFIVYYCLGKQLENADEKKKNILNA